MDNDDTCNANISNWNIIFDKYMELDQKCESLLGKLTEIKNNFHKLLGNQKEDDVNFYKTLIENSHYYMSSCVKVRKLKFVKDLNYICKQMEASKQIDSITKPNFQAIIHDYKKVSDDIQEAKKKNTVLLWVKNDKINSLDELEKEISEILNYHLKLITFTHECLQIKKDFYCGRD